MTSTNQPAPELTTERKANESQSPLKLVVSISECYRTPQQFYINSQLGHLFSLKFTEFTSSDIDNLLKYSVDGTPELILVWHPECDEEANAGLKKIWHGIKAKWENVKILWIVSDGRDFPEYIEHDDLVLRFALGNSTKNPAGDLIKEIAAFTHWELRPLY